MRIVSFLAIALALACSQQTSAQPKAPPKPVEIYDQFRQTMNEGKFDIAGLFLQQFLESNPTDNDFLELEKKYGTTVFQMLRTVPKYSDDPATEKKIRENIEEVIKRSQAATAKLLQNPARVDKFVRNLGATYEERVYAQQELRRTGEYAIPFLVDALRTATTTNKQSRDLYAGILETIPTLEAHTMAGWVAALDGLTVDRQYGVLDALARRRDVKDLLDNAQTNFIPHLWRILSRPRTESPTLQDLALALLNRLVPGAKADTKRPEVELTAIARTFYERKARYYGQKKGPDGSSTISIWVWDAPLQKIIRLTEVPIRQAEEYYTLRYARWALETKEDYAPAQAIMLAMAAERAVERSKFGNLAVTEPAVYKLLSDAPSRILMDLLARGLAEKRTTLVLAMVQVLGDRADRAAATPPAGAVRKPSLLEQALRYDDPQVQFAAATALLRSPVPVHPDVRPAIVNILQRALGADPYKPSASKGTVLLVDPAKFRSDSNALLLRGFGFDVEIHSTGRDLLRRIAKASDFDLIFIDHHAAPPELIDLIGQIQSDAKLAARPVFVIASSDRPRVPTFDQLLVRVACLIAATESDVIAMPAPYIPDKFDTPEDQMKKRKAIQEQRDGVFRSAAATRTARLQRVIDALSMTLTEEQKRVMELRIQLIIYAILATEFPISPESSPSTVAELARIRRQLALQAPIQPYGVGIASTDLMKLIERFELDVAKIKATQDRYDFFRMRVDPVDLGLPVETFRDPVLEARLARLLKEYPMVRIIPEPYSRIALEAELNAVFSDPMMIPRDPTVKRANARIAVEYLRLMATGDLRGYEITAAEEVLIDALIVPDLAPTAIEALERFKTATAQRALMNVVLKKVGEVGAPTRIKAADAVIRHIRANGNGIPKNTVDELTSLLNMNLETDPDLVGKLVTLKGMLATKPPDFVKDLKDYNPPILPLQPKKDPEPKKDPNPKPPEKQ
ncbi:MAG: hypothetical protein L0241_04455 [Planctomycetia bacterium]|nr:hypothetical protein [Planctomycetia bacterium]